MEILEADQQRPPASRPQQQRPYRLEETLRFGGLVGFGLRTGSGGFTWSGADEEKVSDDTVGSANWSLAYETGLGVETGRSVGWTCGTSETRNIIILSTLTP